MKKMLIGAFLGMFAVTGIAVLPNYASATGDVDTELGDWANPNAAGNYISSTDAGEQQTLTGSALLDTIKNAVNWILGILATIALVICLYGGFLMVTAAGDEKKYQKGLSVLKYAAIGLAIIGVSWMIVSVIFWFVRNLGETTASDNNVGVNSATGQGTSTQGGGYNNGNNTNNVPNTNGNGEQQDNSKNVPDKQ